MTFPLRHIVIPLCLAGILAADTAAAPAARAAAAVARPHPLAPAIAPQPPVDVPSGLLFRVQIGASHEPTSFAATGLPAGLTLNPHTGEIAGVCGYNGGTYVATLSAANRHGTATVAQTFVVSGIGPIEMPTVRGIAPPPDGVYRAGDTLVFGVQFVRGYTYPLVTGQPRFAFTIGGHTRYATYDTGSGEEIQFYTYTVTADDPTASGVITYDTIDLNGGTLRDAASLWCALNFPAIQAPGVRIDAAAVQATKL